MQNVLSLRWDKHSVVLFVCFAVISDILHLSSTLSLPSAPSIFSFHDPFIIHHLEPPVDNFHTPFLHRGVGRSYFTFFFFLPPLHSSPTYAVLVAVSQSADLAADTVHRLSQITR